MFALAWNYSCAPTRHKMFESRTPVRRANACATTARVATLTLSPFAGATVILIGTNLSPFSRRVAIAMRILGIDYERRLWSTQKNLSLIHI